MTQQVDGGTRWSAVRGRLAVAGYRRSRHVSGDCASICLNGDAPPSCRMFVGTKVALLLAPASRSVVGSAYGQD
jgi:hypothetical protein